ncbi:MAG: helix-turn-helix transcriptional regulator [Bacillota bacterium]|nr:helix-turn-helix transcriptional regulator [Bacillota bacterium]
MKSTVNSSLHHAQEFGKKSYKSSGCHIGLCLRRLREIQGFSQSDLARDAEVNLSYICSIENHPSNISIKKLLQLCNAMNVPAHMSLRLVSHDNERVWLRNRLTAQWRQFFPASDPAVMRVADIGAAIQPY